jgi:hypothetical protein
MVRDTVQDFRILLSAKPVSLAVFLVLHIQVSADSGPSYLGISWFTCYESFQLLYFQNESESSFQDRRRGWSLQSWTNKESS